MCKELRARGSVGGRSSVRGSTACRCPPLPCRASRTGASDADAGSPLRALLRSLAIAASSAEGFSTCLGANVPSGSLDSAASLARASISSCRSRVLGALVRAAALAGRSTCQLLSSISRAWRPACPCPAPPSLKRLRGGSSGTPSPAAALPAELSVSAPRSRRRPASPESRVGEANACEAAARSTQQRTAPTPPTLALPPCGDKMHDLTVLTGGGHQNSPGSRGCYKTLAAAINLASRGPLAQPTTTEARQETDAGIDAEIEGAGWSVARRLTGPDRRR